jgi:hypothetical protein
MLLCLAASPAEVVGSANANCRWQNAKQPLAGGAAKDLFHCFVAMIAGAKPIAMGNVKRAVVEGECFWLEVNRHGQLLLKIIFHPHVVVAYKKMQLYARYRSALPVCPVSAHNPAALLCGIQTKSQTYRPQKRWYGHPCAASSRKTEQ